MLGEREHRMHECGSLTRSGFSAPKFTAWKFHDSGGLCATASRPCAATCSWASSSGWSCPTERACCIFRAPSHMPETEIGIGIGIETGIGHQYAGECAAYGFDLGGHQVGCRALRIAHHVTETGDLAPGLGGFKARVQQDPRRGGHTIAQLETWQTLSRRPSPTGGQRAVPEPLPILSASRAPYAGGRSTWSRPMISREVRPTEICH